MATKRAVSRGLASRILMTIREEMKLRHRPGLVSSDYYAKQANPKDGGYAKSNYVKGDSIRILPGDLTAKDIRIRVRTKMVKK